MVKIDSLFVAGAHRGGWEFTTSYLNRFRAPSKVTIADPKSNRAGVLAEKWRSAGSKATAYAEPCEEVLQEIPEGSVGMLTVDSILPMATVIEKARLPLQWQILGRSTRNIVLGFSGTLPIADESCRKSSALLLKNLSPYALPVTSQLIRQSVLNNRILNFTRRCISQYSAESVSKLVRDPEIGGLALFSGEQRYPLLILKGEIKPFREIEKMVLEVEDLKVTESKEYAVAVVLPNQVEVFGIEKYRNRKGIKSYTTFGDPIPLEDAEEFRTQEVKTVVTD